MTNANDPSQPIDFSQARAAAAEAQVQVTGSAAPLPQLKFSIGRCSFDLVPKLSLLDESIIQDALDTGRIRDIAESMGRLVLKDQRKVLTDYLLSDPDDPSDVVNTEDLFEAFRNAQEAIAARPTGK